MNDISHPIYLDGFATMPLADEVRRAILEVWMNPSNAGSPHSLGEKGAISIAEARAAVANLIGAVASEIIFTSGATEANNLALLGVCRWAISSGNTKRRIIVSAVEHKAVVEPAFELKNLGFDVIVAPVDTRGVVDCRALSALIDSDTLLCSIMAANNETGVLQPVSEIAALCHHIDVLVHCDAAQAVGKIPLDVVELDVDYLSISSHKMYGPVGVGALYVSATAPTPRPIQFGGGQQSGVRPGTEPVPLIVGFGVAARLAHKQMMADSDHCHMLAMRMLSKLAENNVNFRQITQDAETLPGTLSISMVGICADDIVLNLHNKVCLSTGSACNSGQITSSNVLKSMGFSSEDARSVIRIYCHKYLSIADVDAATALIAESYHRMLHRTGRLRQ